ncbi:Ferric iron ABC transporter, ATP-binding protein [Methylophaga frappieri]|uniref:Ferric iron ABC transporter, ATP-binding protein n=1 Tax=Methylophaga frappieri (strain ATCC BAA-2434 / DSM 25690 / JAM7) TaxID=754477 RepID=I1YHT8_METFJ|nr:ABC transporter ATP-binding protein [Methylophaga frappieri]AFJ02481.1 Ferric iron ABC transporter, ATP-binding protein [Methylophaga frappieri]
MPNQLTLKDVSIAYGDHVVANRISFSLNVGEIGCLLGPSGCGKTSLLRAIAGFEPIQTGTINLDGKQVSQPNQHLPPEQRRIGMVFQDFALFPHLTVADNIGFGLHKLTRQARTERVETLLNLIGLSEARKQYPHQLSGGQQQRVALARAMAPRPDILLLDEPFSSMDSDLREQLAREVRHLLQQDGITAILVTHDQNEAFAMADQIGVLGNGELHQWGTGYELYHQPADLFVADFIGQGALIPGEIIGPDQIRTELGIVTGQIAADHIQQNTVDLLLRPDDVIHDDDSPLKAQIINRAFRGAVYLYTLKLASGQLIYCLVQSHHQHNIGEKLGIRLEAAHLPVFRRQ